MLSFEIADKIFHYDKDTGLVKWKNLKNKHKWKCGIAGYDHQQTGHRYVHFDGKVYKEHRLAWLLHYKEWPNGEIDHINGNGFDNRISNLRVVSRHGNMQNMTKPNALNRSGCMGASKNYKRWRARIKVYGKTIHLGYFDTPEEASAAYVKAKRTLHPTCSI